MTSSTPNRVLYHEILSTAAAWQCRDPIQHSSDVDRICKANKAIEFKRGTANLEFCLLISAGCSHLATVEVETSEKTIKVTVFSLKTDFQQKWTVTYQVPDAQSSDTDSLSWHSRSAMHGGITEDGTAVLLVYSPQGGSTAAYIVNQGGFTRRSPPSDTGESFSMSAGSLSEDSEYLFYVQSGTAFGRNGQAKVVEVYSIRHLSCVRAFTFGFGDGRHMRNMELIQPLHAHGVVHCQIDTKGFRDEEGGRSPSLIASSNKKLQWNVEGLEGISTDGIPNIFISAEHSQLVYITPDTAMLHQWDLQALSVMPLGSVRLPGVEFSQSRRWLIHGKETTMKDAIPRQLRNCRFSPRGRVMTIVTANSSTVTVNVLLAFNLQLIYHQSFKSPQWQGQAPLRIGFNDSTGLTVIGMMPTEASPDHQGQTALYGISLFVFSIPEILVKIKSIEEYFDHVADRVNKLIQGVDNREKGPLCQFSWTPGVIDRDDPESIVLEHGQKPITTTQDTIQQRKFYDLIFGELRASGTTSTEVFPRFLVPHLWSMNYPWAPEQRVSVFGVIMKNTYHIISIGPSPDTTTPGGDVIRALYTTEIKISGDAKEFVEIYQSGPNFILRVFKMDKKSGMYSGAPTPIPRWTLISPHFLEEDAWYDTFIIHQARHVTAPTGWSWTPNRALTSVTNYAAYFEPHTFAVQDQINYGHRRRSAYVLPKYLLWHEYGLRGLGKPNPNEIFFGGGRYQDTLGSYLYSIYEDKTYDDSNPLYPGTFALTCHIGHRSRTTKHVDAFFRRLHQSSSLLLDNCHSISYTLPLACRARPIAVLSFMRHIALNPYKVNDIGAIEVKTGAVKSKRQQQDSKWRWWRGLFRDVKAFTWDLWTGWDAVDSEPNTSSVTLPLPGFCSYNYKLYQPAPLGGSASTSNDAMWDIIRATQSSDREGFSWNEAELMRSVPPSGRRAGSPFTRFVEEILNMKDQATRLSILRVVWLEKLLTWKMETFGRHVYLMRTALPMLVLFIVHFTIGVMLTGNHETTGISIILLASVEGLLSLFILSVKMRQLWRIPRLFLRSTFNYIDGVTLCLGLSMFSLVISKTDPPRAFLGFSTLIIWIATIFTLRIFRPVGLLLLLLTETLQAVFSFLALLFFIITGFAFVPFLLLRNLEQDDDTPNPFSSFPLAFAQMLNFVASDYGSLAPFDEVSSAVKTLRALYIVIVTIFFLNALIAMLNLRIKHADENAGNLYHLQMASLQVEIELGMLSSAERSRRDWFPIWFSYSMTETEKRVWHDYVERNPLKWLEENSFGEDKDHVPPAPAEPRTDRADQVAYNAATSAAKSPDVKTKPKPDKSSQYQPSNVEKPRPKSLPEDSLSESRPSSTNESVMVIDDDSIESSADNSTSRGFQEPKTEPVNDTPISSSPSTACKICGKPGTLCKGCRTIAYCGKEHQKMDWKIHKSVCKGKGRA